MEPRREFIRSVVIAASFVAARPALNAISGRAASRGTASGLPDCADFERLLGTRFRVSGAASGDQWLELDQVIRQSRGSRIDSFSVRFRGSAGRQLPEHLYRFSHPECGAFDFFISPGSSDADSCRYRAIVCRLV